MSEPPVLQLFNTLSGTQEPFTPLEPGKVRMYVCGPTVYDDAHLGHARCYITWDVLYRFLKFLGYDVTYVRNVTDVDDKILKRAEELGVTPQVLSERYYQSFKDDMQALNVLSPEVEPKATEYIEEMQTGISALIENGTAYATADGSVYFRTAAKPDYGKLSKKPLEDLKAGARVEVDPSKESPLDFALWKAVASDDDSLSWPAPWGGSGKGRPGWHMECSAMNHKVLGAQIDIHAGGADLIFPHHENEIAQSECWTGRQPFAKYWLHNGFVNVSGEKMSKSLGNFSTIKKVLERYDANTIRYFLLTNHYRMPVDFNDDALQGPKNWMEKTTRTLREVAHELNLTAHQLPDVLIRQFKQVQSLDASKQGDLMAFCHWMMEDLNTAQALAELNKVLAHLRQHMTTADAKDLFQMVASMMNVLGFDLNRILGESIQLPTEEIRIIYKEMTGKWLESEKAPEALLAEIITMRKQAKSTQNWTQADAIRRHLTDIGLAILDNKDGTTTVEKDGREIVRV